MWTNSEKDRYFARIFKISLVCSLLLLSLVFYIFPRFNSMPEMNTKPVQVKIYVSDIPVTRQQNAKPAPPRRPRSFLPVAGEEAQLPDEIPLTSFPGNSDLDSPVAGLAAEVAARPLLEVYPEVKGSACNGYVRLLLLVNVPGNIASVEVVENSTGSQKCLQLAIAAARKSKWLPAQVNHKAVESWVSKTYKFNINE